MVLPTIGALIAACENNPFVAAPPPAPIPFEQRRVVPTTGVVVAPGVAAPGVMPVPPGVMPIPVGSVAPLPMPYRPGVTVGTVRPPGVARPGVRVGRVAPGRPAPPGLMEFKPQADAPATSIEARSDARRASRMNGGGRDPGCAGAGAVRRRGPV